MKKLKKLIVYFPELKNIEDYIELRNMTDEEVEKYNGDYGCQLLIVSDDFFVCKKARKSFFDFVRNIGYYGHYDCWSIVEYSPYKIRLCGF